MQKPSLKKTFLSFSAIFIFILYFPIVFANNNSSIDFRSSTNINETNLYADSLSEKADAKPLYDRLQLNLLGLSPSAFDYALDGLQHLTQTGKLNKSNIITIADFSLHSSQKRFFVIDLEKEEILFNTYVAHGAGTGAAMANNFSNQPESHKSSLGFYTTLQTYQGGHGYSLRLDGLEKGINDNANSRAIVIHGAAYVSESFIKARGYIGRSWGCPALPENLNKPIINAIKDGTCLFIYSPDKNYLQNSRIINA